MLAIAGDRGADMENVILNPAVPNELQACFPL